MNFVKIKVREIRSPRNDFVKVREMNFVNVRGMNFGKTQPFQRFLRKISNALN